MNGYDSIRENYPQWAAGCSVDDLLYIVQVSALLLIARGLLYAASISHAAESVNRVWQSDRGGQALEARRRGTSGVVGA